MPENLLIHTLSDEHTNTVQKALSAEVMTDTTVKKVKSEEEGNIL